MTQTDVWTRPTILFFVVMAGCSRAPTQGAGDAAVDQPPSQDAPGTVDVAGSGDVRPSEDLVAVDQGPPMEAGTAVDVGASIDLPLPDASAPTDAGGATDGRRRDGAGADDAGDAAAMDLAATDLAAMDLAAMDLALVDTPPPTDGGAPAGKQTLFYLDVSGKVMSLDTQASKATTVVASAGQGPDGLAVDPTHGYLYWTTMGVTSANDGTVMRSKLDGSQVTTIVPKGGTFTPKQMKIDLPSDKIYWSDREGMQVQRANADGTQLETLVTVATGDTARADLSNHCVGIALDTAGGWLYWTQKGPTNGHVGSIRRAHLAMPAGQTAANRTDIEILYTGLPEPIDMDIDVEAGLLYWTDRGDGTVSRGPIAIPAGATAATRTDRQIIVSKATQAIGIVLDKPHGVLYFTSANGQVGRAGLDGKGEVDLLTNAGALTGIVVIDAQ